jgi:hypothetical protein
MARAYARAIKLVIGTLAVALCLCGSAAGAAYPPWVMAIQDCAWDGKLDHQYPEAVLRKAIGKMRSDGNEYSDCTNALRAALEGGGRPASAPAPTGVVTESGAVAAGDADVASLQTLQADAASDYSPAPVRLGGEVVAAQSGASDALNGVHHWNQLPAPLVVLLIGLGAALSALFIALATRRRPG